MTTRSQYHRLREVLEAYGADPARWPPDERDDLAALALRAGDDIATAQHAAAEIDLVLGQVRTPALPAGGVERLLDRARAERAARTAAPVEIAPEVAAGGTAHASGLHGGRLWTGLALAACLIVGIYVGLDGNLASYLPGSEPGATLEVANLADQTGLAVPYALLELDNL